MSWDSYREGESAATLHVLGAALHACAHCADGTDPQRASRRHILHLLALIEHPQALPADAALRLAGELLHWCEANDARTEAPSAPPLRHVA